MKDGVKKSLVRKVSILGPSYTETTRSTAVMANKKIDRIANLLIIIAFSTIGLSSQLLSGGATSNGIISWSIIFLVFSIVFGLLQLIVDYIYFNRAVEIYRHASSVFNVILSKTEKEIVDEDKEKFMGVFENLKKAKNTSNITFLFIELALVVCGSAMILSELLF